MNACTCDSSRPVRLARAGGEFTIAAPSHGADTSRFGGDSRATHPQNAISFSVLALATGVRCSMQAVKNSLRRGGGY